MKRELLAFGLGSDGQFGGRCHGGGDNLVQTPENVIGVPIDDEGTTVKAVAMGEKHTLFLTLDGGLWSVGCNEKGQLGRGPAGAGSFTIYPLNLGGGVRIVQVAVGKEHSMAVSDDGRIFGWGSNFCGQLGLPSNIQTQLAPRRIPSLTEVVQVACGPEHTITLLESGRVFVFGQQTDGACYHSPTEVASLMGIPIVRVAAGGRHCVTVSASGSVFVWGQNDYGQLGTADTKIRIAPVELESIRSMHVVEVACGDAHTVLLTAQGRIFVFGSDAFGQLGLGRKRELQSSPQGVMELMGTHVTRISAGRCHTAVIVNGQLWTWGLNSSGQLGNGSYRTSITPRRVEGLDHTRAVFAGWDQTCVLRASGIGDVASGPNVELREPKFLRKAVIFELLAKNDKLSLIGELEAVFSSFSCLNGSFLFTDDRKFCCDGSNHGVNLDDVRDAFNEVAHSKDAQQMAELMLESLSLSFLHEECTPRDFISPECLRVFLTIPWLHPFADASPNVIFNLHKPFAQSYGQLKKAYQDILKKWWSKVEARHFKRLASSMVKAVENAVIASGSQVDTRQLVAILKLLETLSEINRVTNRIPIECFYVNSFKEKGINIAYDYYRWLMSRNTRSMEFFWSDYPFLFNGITKGELLFVDAQLEMQQRVEMSAVNFMGLQFLVGQPVLNLVVRRDHIVDDTIRALQQVPQTEVHKRLKISFVGEEGDDAGGVQKEFFWLLFQRILSAEYGMFVEDQQSHLVWFSGAENDIQQFQLVGLLVGLAVYNSVLVDFPFPLALYKQILGQKLALEDLCELNPIEGRGLHQLLDYTEDDVDEVFGLNFTITHLIYGHPTTVELKPHGNDIVVNARNREEYVELYVQSRLSEGVNGELKKQRDAFNAGFRYVVHARILDFFQPRELMEICVGNENYDWTEFKKVAHYKGEYHAKHPTILAFWDAFFELSLEDRKKFLQFLIGTTRVPVGGIKDVQWGIQPCADHLLPVSHTCFGLLDLPNLADKQELKRRLLVSIENAKGFTIV